MKSVILTKYGAPEVLKVKEFKNPEPLDNEVRIKVHYAGINFAEIMSRMKLYPGGPKPGSVLGFEASGIIDKIGKNKVNCIREGKDQYKRTLAECFVNDLSLSRFLVREGYAFAYRKYSKKFIDDENYARENNLGMWSMNFEFPWDYRKKN